jgi:type II secretion system protein I
MSWSIGLPAGSPSPADGRGCRKGFTLLEVLVALAILGFAMVATLQALSGGLEGTRRAKATAQALLLARSLLDRVGTELPLVPGTVSGEAGGAAHWTVRISQHSLANTRARLALFDVVVTVGEVRGEAVSLATLRLGPRQ